MVGTAQAAAGMSVPELHRDALAAFGGRHRTRGITERLDAALALGVRAGRLQAVDGVVAPV